MTSNFGPVLLSTEGEIARIEIDAPPVNALSSAVRVGLSAAIAQANAQDDVSAILLSCRGRTFSVGADIRELGKPRVPPSLPDVLGQIESADKPVIAVIHGMALGGGLELALAAHYRIASDNARCGLPEVNIGILPGAGGTQRLPRLVGVDHALDLITSGKQISAPEALSFGLFDKIVPASDLDTEAIKFAIEVLSSGRALRRIRDLDDKIEPMRGKTELFDAFKAKTAKKFRGLKAPQAIISAVQAAVKLPFEEGLAEERRLLDQLLAGDQPAALRHIFFAEREAVKIPGLAQEVLPLPIERVGVIGAGTMGGGIAMNFLNIGVPVTIVDLSVVSLERGLSTIARNYEGSLKRGKVSKAEIESRMSNLLSSTDLEELASCDLIIEAVFENMSVKKKIFSQLDQIAKPGAILATNTSYLDVDEIAAVTQRPESVIGLHFFSPANIMKLLEIVRAEKTSDRVLVTALEWAKKIGKTAAVVGNRWGFVGNRILQARQREAESLILEGAAPWDVDRVLYDFGFPMGPFQMRDLVGLDVGWDPEDTASRTVREILNEMGRHGQKTSGGFYDYDDERNRTPSPIAEKIILEFAEREGITRRQISDEEIHDRTLFAMINEGAHILEEGIASRASDIDIIWVTGYGWPKYLGGPMYWAERIGLSKIVSRLRKLEAEFGEQFRPARLLVDRAESDQKFDLDAEL